MKVSVAGVVGEDEAQELIDDLAILVWLSTVRDANARLARERDTLLAAIASRRQPIEPTFDQASDPLAADLSLRLEALAEEQVAADGLARCLIARLSPEVRRIYASLSAARRHPSS